jgi:hypothetical protein
MSKPSIKSKRTGTELSMRTFHGKEGQAFLVFRTGKGSFHTFVETEAKQAARDCGVSKEGTTRQMWSSLWSDIDENG